MLRALGDALSIVFRLLLLGMKKANPPPPLLCLSEVGFMSMEL